MDDQTTSSGANSGDRLAPATARSGQLERKLSALEIELDALIAPQPSDASAAQPGAADAQVATPAEVATPAGEPEASSAAAEGFVSLARRQVADLAQPRIERLTALADELAHHAEDVLGRLQVTAAARAQLDELVSALGAVAAAVAREAAQSGLLPPGWRGAAPEPGEAGGAEPATPARLRSAPTPMSPSTPISFARGAPSLDIVDVDGLREAAARAFANDPGGATAYGTSVGYPKLRAWIAERHGVRPENVLVTNGSMQADAFLFDELVREGDDVVVERPTYDRTLLALRGRGARVHAITLQPDGIDTDALATALGEGSFSPRLAHVIPNFQNPAGYTLSALKRDALLDLAREHDFIVFEDDPYVALRFRGEPLPTMLSLDGAGDRVVYASSFSKTVCPGIRVGYLVGAEPLIAAIAKRATNTYISPSMVSQAIVYEFCVSGAIEQSIETVRTALAERARALAEALERELPQAEFVEPDGGYFMWVTLPAGSDVNLLFQAAGDRGVAIVKGTDFVLDGGENTFRLAYSGVTVPEIDEGVARLAAAAREVGAGVYA